MEKIAVSVIMPVYNVEAYLKRAVKSVVMQAFTDYEIILVDDGSTDSSGEMCDELAGYNDKIKVIHKQNGGISSARNTGLAAAVGKYVYFLDPDDYCVGELLSENVAIAEKYGSDQVIFGFTNIICDEKDREIRRVEYAHNLDGEYDFDEFKSIYKAHLENVAHVVWNRLYRRDAIGDVRFDESLTTAEDAVFNLELLSRGISGVYYNSKSYYRYMCRRNSLMNKYNPVRFENEMLLNDSVKELVESWGVGEGYDMFLAYKYVETALCEYSNMTMHNCTLTDDEIINRLKNCFSDVRVKESSKKVSKTDFKSLSLRYLYTLSKDGKYKKALQFKRIYSPLSRLAHKCISAIKGQI